MTVTRWEIRHRMEGRARVWVDGLYRSSRRKRALEAELTRWPGIHRVRANELTGTVLIHFDPDRDLTRLLRTLDWDQGTDRAEPRLAEPPSTPWYALAADQVLSQLGIRRDQGLSAEKAVSLRERFGANRLPAPHAPSDWELVADQLKSLPVTLLLGSAALSLLTGGLGDAVTILAVVAMNAGMGFRNERQAHRVIRALSRTGPRSSQVVRDGRPMDVPTEDIAPGDILVLSPGIQIAADARLIQCRGLTTDESALTGESVLVEKTASPVEGAAAGTKRNMVYRGTTITGGSGLGVVVATGLATETGKIHRLVSETAQPETPLQKQLNQVGRQLVVGTGVACGAVFAVGVCRRYGWVQMLKTSISLAVAAIPEGLPAVATTAVAVAILKMRKRNLLVRRMQAIETLGAVEVICLDKTGTLTLNRMAVKRIFTGMAGLVPAREGFRRQDGGDSVAPEETPEFLRLLLVAVLCNEATATGAEEGAYWIGGSPTEQALLQMALDCGIEVDKVRRAYPLLETEYRSESRSYMTTLHEASGRKRLLAVKGRPNEVLDLCRWQERDGRILPLGEKDRKRILSENRDMAEESLRVLGVAYRLFNGVGGDEGLIWLGLVGMADPPRQGVKEVLERFHGAGVRTLMLTGDQSTTAYAIGRELGMNGVREIKVADAARWENLSPQAIQAICEESDIISNVTPSQKLKIVEALRAQGKIVAMTGDGINDGPALRAADVGIAMGEGGTEVAREVGDLVLRDDNLSTLVAGLEQGRATYDNIRKTVHFIISTNLSEIFVVLGSVSAGIGSPLTPAHLLWINLVTDVFPALALSVEPPEKDILSRPPRDPRNPLLGRNEMKRIFRESARMSLGALGSYAYGVLRHGPGSPAAGTAAFMNLATAQLLHAHASRYAGSGERPARAGERNPYLAGAIAGGLALQALAFFAPPLRRILGLAPLPLADLAVTQIAAVANYALARGNVFSSPKQTETEEAESWRSSSAIYRQAS